MSNLLFNLRYAFLNAPRVALIYNTEGNDHVDWETSIQQYGQFGTEHEESGGMLGGDALQPMSTAT